MARQPRADSLLLSRAYEIAGSSEESGPPLEERVRTLQEVRSLSTDMSCKLDEALLTENINLRTALVEAGDNLEKMKKLIDRFSSMPLFPATFLQYEDSPAGVLALVSCANGMRVVAISEDASAVQLRSGQDVYLGSEQSVLVGTVSAPRRGGEIAEFERVLPDGRLILKRGDERIVAEAAETLALTNMRSGDPIRWDRAGRIAHERLENSPAESKFTLHRCQDIPLTAFAGSEKVLGRVLDALSVSLNDHDLSRKYGLSTSNTVLMYGPPGCGKTLIAEVALAEIARRTDRKASFVVIQASAFASMWVGESERNVRDCFASLRQAALHGPALLFLDEIESLGRLRGGTVGHHDDKLLATILTEIDGFSRQSNIAVIAASNRRDLLDPALISRMGVQVPIARPGMRAARAIMAVHLDECLPYHPNGTAAAAEATRFEIIDYAISRLYAPNAGNELCAVKSQNGKCRVVTANEMVSGRLLKQICSEAKNSAYRREASKRGQGIQLADIESAVNSALVQLSTTLTPQNVHHYLEDLPTDEVIVSVVPHFRRVPSRQRYLTGAQGGS
jgi:proteasome ATPase